MEKKVVVVFVLLFCVLYTAAIAAQDRKSSISDSNAMKAEVVRLGFGQRVDVQLRDGAKTGGRITGLAEDRFVVTTSKGDATPIAFTEVERITKQKEKLGIFHKPWVGIMFTAAGVGTLIVLALQLLD